ncbi:hypothetical protein TNCV_3746861 [Trichonephila clavipes]|nr:hypothetical protein TNCV_3746861 [Trichonephila clavipes]
MGSSNGDTLTKSFPKVVHNLVDLLRKIHEDCEVVIGETAEGFLLPSSEEFVYSQCLTRGRRPHQTKSKQRQENVLKNFRERLRQCVPIGGRHLVDTIFNTI